MYDPVASSIRCPEDGVFVSQDKLVTAWVAVETAMETADAIGLALQADFEVLELWVAEQMNAAIARAHRTFNDAITMVGLVAIVAIVLWSFLGLFIAKSIVKPVDEVVETSKQVPQRNLSVGS